MAAAAEPTDKSMPWAPIIALIGGAAGGAAWVSIVGGAVLAARLHQAGVPTSPSVALVPQQLTVVIGLRFLVLPIGFALLAFAAIFVESRIRATSNPAGQAPYSAYFSCGLWFVIGTVVAIASSSLDFPGQLILVALSIVGPLMAVVAIYATRGLTSAAVVMFTTVLLISGVGAFVYEYFRAARLDIAVVELDNQATTSGFYLAEAPDAVILVTASRPRQSPNTIDQPSGGNRPIYAADGGCSPAVVEEVQLLGGGRHCYLREVTAIPMNKITRLYLGPRGVTVDAAGFNTAARLAMERQPTFVPTASKRPG
jgi:hypothetical protein